MQDSFNPQVAAEDARDTYRKKTSKFEGPNLDPPSRKQHATLPRRPWLRPATPTITPKRLSTPV